MENGKWRIFSIFYIIGILFVIVDNIVHEIHHGFGHLEDSDGLVEPAIAFKESIGNNAPANSSPSSVDTG